MFDPLTIGTIVIGYQLFKRQGGPAFGAMTPQREEVFNNALEHLKDPERLKKLADVFEQEGLKTQASILRRRAAWRARDQKTKDEHEAIFQKALQSKNVDAILRVALAFEGMTATLKAKQLREHAEKVKTGEKTVIETTAEVKPVEKPAEPLQTSEGVGRGSVAAAS